MFCASAISLGRSALFGWLTAAAVCLQPSSTIAQSEGLSPAQRAVVQEMVVLICGTFELNGSSSRFDLDVNAKAELNTLFQRFADLGVEGDVKLSADDYSNVLQSDLAPHLQGVTECRLIVWKDLLARFPSPSERSEGTSSKQNVIKIEKIEATRATAANVRVKNLLLQHDGARIFLDAVHFYYATSSTRALWRDCDMQDLPFERETRIDFPLPLPGDGNADGYHCKYRIRLNFAKRMDLELSDADEVSILKVRKYFLVNAIQKEQYMLLELNEAQSP